MYSTKARLGLRKRDSAYLLMYGKVGFVVKLEKMYDGLTEND